MLPGDRGVGGYGPSDGSLRLAKQREIICMPQMRTPCGKSERAGPGGKLCSSNTPIPKEQQGQVHPILLSSFTNPAGLGSGKPAASNWSSIRKGAAAFYYGQGPELCWDDCSFSPPQGGFWSLSAPPPHHPIHKAKATIIPFFPELYPLVQFLHLFLHQSLQQLFPWFCCKPNQSLPSPALALNYFAARSTHLRLAVPGSDQLTHLPQSSAVGCFLPARLWVLLGRLVQQPRSPRVLGRRQALPCTKC